MKTPYEEAIKVLDDSINAYRTDIWALRKALRRRSESQKEALNGEVCRDMAEAYKKAAAGSKDSVPYGESLECANDTLVFALDDVEVELMAFDEYVEDGLKVDA
jgi:hypothetical protein